MQARRAPHAPLVGTQTVPVRVFPWTRGEDRCGDYHAAEPEVYREDFREKLGPWFKVNF